MIVLDPGSPKAWSATPVVLVHGFLGEPADWDAVVADLRVRREVWRADLLAARVAQCDLSSLAQALAEAIALHDLAPATVVGYSLGGRVAMTLLKERPETVRRVLAVSATPGLADPEERRERAAADDRLAEALARQGLAAFIDRWYAQPLFASLRSHPDYALVARRRLDGDGAAWASVLRDASPGRSPSMWDDLPVFAQRLALAVGSLDAKYLDLARIARERVPGLPIVVVEGAGHAVHLERPESLADLIDRLP